MAAALLSILGGEEKETDPVIQYHPDNCISGLALKVYTVAANAVLMQFRDWKKYTLTN